MLTNLRKYGFMRGAAGFVLALFSLLIIISLFACGQPKAGAAPPEQEYTTAPVPEPEPPSAMEPPRIPDRMPAPSRPPTAERPPLPTMGLPPVAENGGHEVVVPTENEVDRILSNLREGQVVFDSPNSMRFEYTQVIEVVLYPEGLAVPRLSEDEEVGSALVSSRMEATLTGLGFSIVATTPAVQAISGVNPTTWRWQVTPVEKGDLVLDLSLNAIIEVEGERTSYVIRTFSEEIEVEVTVGQQVTQFFGDNWKWLWTAIFIPIGGLAVKKWKSKKNG